MVFLFQCSTYMMSEEAEVPAVNATEDAVQKSTPVKEQPEHEGDPAPPKESSVPNGDSNGHPEAAVDSQKPSDPVPAAETLPAEDDRKKTVFSSRNTPMDTSEPAEATEAKAAGDVPPPEDERAESDTEKWEVVEEEEIAKAKEAEAAQEAEQEKIEKEKEKAAGEADEKAKGPEAAAKPHKDDEPAKSSQC
ncbi:hypothetical protein COOONC_18125 [Cooperia oncophora]